MKIIGYKLNGRVSRGDVDRFLDYSMPFYGDMLLSKTKKKLAEITDEEKAVYFTTGHIGGALVQKCKDAGVLDLWFTPIYQEEYKVGDYVHVKNYAGIVKITELTPHNYFKGDMLFENGFKVEPLKDLIICKASDDKIKNTLLCIAEFRGYIPGVKFKSLYGDKVFEINEVFHSFDGDGKHILLNKNGPRRIYDGEWAEIIKIPTVVENDDFTVTLYEGKVEIIKKK